MWMWQLVHGYSGSSRAIVAEELAVHIVVSCEIVHIHKISRYFNDILKFRVHTLKYVPHVFEDGPGLSSNVEVSRPILIHLCAGNRVIGTARARPRHEQEIARAFDVRILAARLRLSRNHFA